MKLNIPNHPCGGKCAELKEQCLACFILTPTCDYCGSDDLVMQAVANDGWICSDCVDELKPVALFIISDIDRHMARAVVAQGEIS